MFVQLPCFLLERQFVPTVHIRFIHKIGGDNIAPFPFLTSFTKLAIVKSFYSKRYQLFRVVLALMMMVMTMTMGKKQEDISFFHFSLLSSSPSSPLTPQFPFSLFHSSRYPKSFLIACPTLLLRIFYSLSWATYTQSLLSFSLQMQ